MTSICAHAPPPALRVAPGLRECPDCGLVQAMPDSRPGQTIRCVRCAAWLRNRRADPVRAALACALTSAILYLIAIATPLMTLDLIGRTNTVSILTGPFALAAEDPWLAAIGTLVGLTTILVPGVIIGTDITLFLGVLRDPMPGYTARLLRLRRHLRQWAMIEVYMLGIFVAYTKLVDLAHVELGPAVFALAGIMVLMIATDGAFDAETVWERACADRLERAGCTHAAAPSASNAHRFMSCHDCGLVMEAEEDTAADADPHAHHPGHRCPRCGAIVHRRKRDSLRRTMVWLIAAMILYVPANLLPILSLDKLGRGGPSTILAGVEELYASGMLPLALLVFFASITVPCVKIVGLAIMVVATRRRSAVGLHDRTRLFRVVDFIGRWSMIDVFMISILVAVVRFGFLANVHAEHGVVAFASVVILTIFAVESFDPRLMWDVAEQGRAA